MRYPVLATLLLAFAGNSPAAQRPEAVFRLEPYRKTVALRAEVNGHAGLFTFDTAGGLTLLSPTFAKTVGCEPWGRLSGHRMMGDRLDASRCDEVTFTIEGRTFTAPVTAVVDVAQFVAKDAAPVEGSIALDLFAGRTITIDFPNRQLIVESAESARERVRTAHELPMKLSREMQGRALAASVGVPTKQGMLWMELDSGNGGTVLVAGPYARLLGLDPELEGPQPVDFALSPDVRVHADMGFAPGKMILDGNIGMPFLKDKVVTLDLAAGRLWVAAPAKP